ncbi:MAG: nitroreductase family protein [Anaerolineales bacterium]|nr:nitroreductase family protein [Anaerolineales bacterium]
MTFSPSLDFHPFIRSRRSVRRFLPDPVPRAVIERVLETGTYAPSAHNRQPWRFAVLTTSAAKTHLADAMGADFRRDLLADGLSLAEIETQITRSHARICEAPVVILLCLTLADMDTYPDEKRQRAEYLMATQSVALAGGTILLAAHAEGLGGVWVCAPLFAPDTVRGALSLPPDWEPQGMLLMGYPAVVPEARVRKAVEEVTFFVNSPLTPHPSTTLEKNNANS